MFLKCNAKEQITNFQSSVESLVSDLLFNLVPYGCSALKRLTLTSPVKGCTRWEHWHISLQKHTWAVLSVTDTEKVGYLCESAIVLRDMSSNCPQTVYSSSVQPVMGRDGIRSCSWASTPAFQTCHSKCPSTPSISHSAETAHSSPLISKDRPTPGLHSLQQTSLFLKTLIVALSLFYSL